MAVVVRTRQFGGFKSRSIWSIATESLDSLGTLVFSVWMAREVSAAEFGAFALGLSVHQVAVGLSTGAGSLTMLVRLGTSNQRFSRRVAGDVAGVTLATAVLPIVAYLAIASGGGALTTASLAFIAISPALLLQASCIHIFYARQQQKKALLNNAIWLGVQIPLLLTLPPLLAPNEAWSYLLSWGVAAYVAVFVSMAQLRTFPRLNGVPDWVREHRATMSDLMLENTAGRVALQGGTWVLGGVAGLRVLGGFRASQIIYGLTRVFNVGLAPMVLAEGVRIFQSSPHRLLRLIRGWMALNAVMCLAIGVVLLTMPDAAGRAIAGDSWRYAEQILVWAVAIAMSNAVLVPAQTGLRSVGATRLSAVIRTVTSPLPALGTLVGGLLGTGYTAMMGFAIGSILTTLIAVAAFEMRIHESPRASRRAAG